MRTLKRSNEVKSARSWPNFETMTSPTKNKGMLAKLNTPCVEPDFAMIMKDKCGKIFEEIPLTQ